MLMEAGILSDAYPLRPARETSTVVNHSLHLRRSDPGRVYRLYEEVLRDTNSEANPGTGAERGGLASAARDFARFAAAWSKEHDTGVGRAHVEAAYALLHRRVEAMPRRSDRTIAAGLAAAALAGDGLRVHLVTDHEQGTNHARAWLFPVFARLGLDAAVIHAGSDETARATAYSADITLVTARELAMDFLRDAVHWPGRSNSAQRSIDRLMGSRSRTRSIVMRGLPCAVHIDIDSALIDNARTPIVLTRDAHPMHEAEELKRALALADRLEIGRDFQLTGEGRELVFTDAGRRRIVAWGEQLGGLWSAGHVAELLLSVAVIAKSVLNTNIHYRVTNGSVEWLVQERLVPGAEFYSKPFITRMVETLEECPVSSQREEVGRASYQQVFNHYVHLCGLCHSLDGIKGELRSVYGLKSGSRVNPAAPIRFSAAHLAPSQEGKLQWAREWAERGGDNTCSVVTANSNESLERLHQVLAPAIPGLQVLTEAPDRALSELLRPGVVLLAPAAALDYPAPRHMDPVYCPVRILVTERSASRTTDRRNLFWMQAQSFEKADKTLLLAADDDLLNNSGAGRAQSVIESGGPRLAALLLERWIRRLQAAWGKEMYRVRRDLLTHETNMQGLLSFSGRGIYE